MLTRPQVTKASERLET